MLNKAYISFLHIEIMKKLFRSLLLSSLLFNVANSQTDFLWQKEFKVSHNEKTYLSKEYKEKGKKRKFAYFVYELDENSKAINLIGDEEDEFGEYWSTALASNYFSDRWNMRQDLSNIEKLFSETNKYYQINEITHNLTEKLTKFGTEITFTKDFTKENLVEKVNEEYLDKLKEFGKQIGNGIVNDYLDGKIKNEEDLKRILKEKFFDKSVAKTQDIISGLETYKKFLKNLNHANSEEILNFRRRLYDLLDQGYENYAMQRAWILFINDPLNKTKFIGREVLETSLNQIEGGDQVYEGLVNLGLDFESLDKKLSQYVEKELKRVLEILHRGIFLEENEFNLRDKNSLASRFFNYIEAMKKNSSKEIEITKDFWSIEEYQKKDAIRFEENSLIFDLNCPIACTRVSNANLTRYNFKEINKNAEITFDAEFQINEGGYDRIGGLYGYIGLANLEGKIKDLYQNYNTYKLLGCNCKAGAVWIKNNDQSGFVESWKIKIIPKEKKYIVERSNKNNPKDEVVEEFKFSKKDWEGAASIQFVMGVEVGVGGDYRFLAKFKDFKIKFE